MKPNSPLLYKKMRHVRPNSSLLTTPLRLIQTKGTSYRIDVPPNEPAKRHTTHALLYCTLAGTPRDYGCQRKEKENKEKEKKRKTKHKERRKIEKMNYLFFRNCDVQFILTILLLNIE
jgi:hypothetical protein